jgi:hypothetical protein
VSRALLLDRPRQGLKAALGRSDDDEVDTAVATPQPKPTTPVTWPGRRPKPVKFTPQKKLRIWIAATRSSSCPGESLPPRGRREPRRCG